MWEMEIACKQKNEKLLDFICKKMENIEFKSILTKFKNLDFSYILFACEKKYEKQNKKLIKNIIIEYITEEYKYNYIYSELENLESTYRNVLASSILLFGLAYDKLILDDLLNIERKIFVDSFIEFRMKNLINSWNDSIKAIYSSNRRFYSANEILQLSKFLVGISDSCKNIFKVLPIENKFSIYKVTGNLTRFIKDIEGYDKFIKEIIISNPNKIKIYSMDQNKFSILKKVYGDRISII